MSKVITMASSGYQMSDQSVCGSVTASGLPILPVPRKKIHCILPSSPWLADSKTNIPLGVLYIAGLLRHAGHEVVVTSMLDKRYEGNIHLPDAVMDADVHMLGFCTPQFGEALEIAAYIRDRSPHALIVAGGPHPSYEPAETKAAGRQEQYHVKGVLSQRRDYTSYDGSAPLFDSVVVMEGETATLQLLSDWHQGKLQPFYYGDKADAMDLDAIPFPAWDLLPEDHIYNDGVAVMKKPYVESSTHPGKYPVMSLIGTRGCPYKCFVAGTPVLLADGTETLVEMLRIGDRLLGFDAETGIFSPQRVVGVGQREADDIYEAEFADGRIIRATGDHPFWTRSGWQKLQDLNGIDVRSMSAAVCAELQDCTVSILQPMLEQSPIGTTFTSAESTKKETTSALHRLREGSTSRSSNLFRSLYVRVYRSLKAWRLESSQTTGGSCKNLSDSQASSSGIIGTLEQVTRGGANTASWLRAGGSGCSFEANAPEQSDVSAGNRREIYSGDTTSIQGRANETAGTRVSEHRRVTARSVIQSLGNKLRGNRSSPVLDWSMRVWTSSKSRFLEYVSSPCGTLQSPLLAYAGGHTNSVARLCIQGVDSAEPMGRVYVRFSATREDRSALRSDWITLIRLTFVGRGVVYPVTVEGLHTFIANGLVTHNCTYCFVEGTLVDMADGSRQPIESLELGDLVLAFDQSTGYTQAQAVKAVGMRMADDIYKLILEDGTVLGVTGDHPFVTLEGWKNAKDCEGSYVRRLRQSIHESPKDVLRRVSQRSDGTLQTGRPESSQTSRSKGDFSRKSERIRRASDGRTGESACGTSLENSFLDPRTTDSSSRANEVVQTYPRDSSEVEREAQKGIRRGTTDHSSETSGQVLCTCISRYNQASEAVEARYSSEDSGIRTDEVEQSDEGSAGTEVSWSNGSDRLPRRTYEAPFASSFERCRTAVVRLLQESRTAARSLRWQPVLDRAMSVWKATQSGYAPCFGEASNFAFVPLLAYAGGYGNSVTGLSQQGMVGTEFLGRRSPDEHEQGFGRCLGERILGDWIPVVSVTFVGSGQVYPISVDVNETFFAHGIATHNCSTPWIGQKPRYRSPENIIAEMHSIMEHGVHMIKMQDDTYTLHKTKLRALAEAMNAEFGYDSFASRIHTRVNTMDDHVAESLKLMNCKVTCFGIESGSQRVLDANQKGTKVQQNTDAVKRAKDNGFYTIGFLVIGMSGETMETMRETQEWLLSVKPYLDSCNLAVGIPYPGSRWWTHPQESGIEIVDYNYDNQWIVGFSDRDEILVRPHGSTVEDMFKIKNEMFNFLVEHGWAKAEWQEDVRIRRAQEAAAAAGTLASTLSYAGH